MLLFVGLLSPLKRPTDLILAHQDLRTVFPNLQTVFCGDDEKHGYMSELQAVAGDGICFRGRVDLTGLMDLLSRATALVLPSAQENAPNVIAEAMAAGVPVVATRAGGIPDMIKHGETGLLYEVGDVAGLTDCLRRLLTEPALCKRLGHQAREVAQATYSTTEVAAATVATYRQLLDRQGAAESRRAHV